MVHHRKKGPGGNAGDHSCRQRSARVVSVRTEIVQYHSSTHGGVGISTHRRASHPMPFTRTTIRPGGQCALISHDLTCAVAEGVPGSVEHALPSRTWVGRRAHVSRGTCGARVPRVNGGGGWITPCKPPSRRSRLQGPSLQRLWHRMVPHGTAVHY